LGDDLAQRNPCGIIAEGAKRFDVGHLSGNRELYQRCLDRGSDLWQN
jgi:hypothetical protein